MYIVFLISVTFKDMENVNQIHFTETRESIDHKMVLCYFTSVYVDLNNKSILQSCELPFRIQSCTQACIYGLSLYAVHKAHTKAMK